MPGAWWMGSKSTFSYDKKHCISKIPETWFRTVNNLGNEIDYKDFEIMTISLSRVISLESRLSLQK